jgi:hypothetical protein
MIVSASIQFRRHCLLTVSPANQAVLTLKDDKPVLEFVGVGRSDHVKELHRVLERATKSVGGTFVPNPWFSLLGEHQVTVHPIGCVLTLLSLRTPGFLAM